MKKTYQVQVDGEYKFKLSQNELDDLNILSENQTSYHIIHKNKSFRASILDTDFQNRLYTVEINGRKFEVKIDRPLDLMIEEMGLSVKSEKNVNELIAPMPGLIIKIDVNEGDEVKENQALLILEAMKMENVMVAPRDGMIKTISVKSGDTVEKNSLLIELE